MLFVTQLKLPIVALIPMKKAPNEYNIILKMIAKKNNQPIFTIAMQIAKIPKI